MIPLDSSPPNTVQLPLDQVDLDPQQIRKERDVAKFAQLKASIAQLGLLVPVHVVPVGTRWKLIDGHGRYLSLHQLGSKTIAAIVMSSDLAEADLLIQSLVINCCRSDLHFLDRAEAFRQLLQKHTWTQTKLAAETGEDIATVNKLLAIAHQDDMTKQTIRDQQMKFVQAYQLCRMTKEERERKLQPCGQSGSEASSITVKRVACPLASGITVTVQGRALSMEDFLFSLEYVLKEGRKHKAKNIDVTTVGKLFQDQAKAGGKS